jgi:hypothetical protein
MNYAEQVKSVINGRSMSLTEVCISLHISKSALYTHLKREGTSYKEITGGASVARKTKARPDANVTTAKVLAAVTMPMTLKEVAAVVEGFSFGAVRKHADDLVAVGKLSYKKVDGKPEATYSPVKFQAADILSRSWDASLELGEMA